MRFIFYILVLIQFFSLLDVLADKIKKEQIELKIKWEKVIEEKSNNLKKIIWKSYDPDEKYFENIKINNNKNNPDKILFKTKNEIYKFRNQQQNIEELLEIQPHIPLNNFLHSGNFIASSNLVSAFSGGAGGGTGHQNYGLKFHYGLTDFSLFSLYFSEADDPLYNLIEGELIPNNWTNFALAYQQQIFESENYKNYRKFPWNFKLRKTA